jgi:hypothetical protein
MQHAGQQKRAQIAPPILKRFDLIDFPPVEPDGKRQIPDGVQVDNSEFVRQSPREPFDQFGAYPFPSAGFTC